MSDSNLSNLKTILSIMLFGAIIGAVYAELVYLSRPNPQGSIWVGVFIGMLLSGGSSAFEVLFVSKPQSIIRALPTYLAFLVRLIVHLIIISASIFIVQLAYNQITGSDIFLIGGNLEDTLTDIGFSVVIVSLIIFWMQMRVFIGSRTLNNLIIGKYHKPQSEERIFMIVDVVGSTAAAEKIGDEKFHMFLNRLFILFDEAIHKNGGEVHSYVGDAIIIVWPFSQDENANGRVFKTLKALHRICLQSRDAILRDFGVKPEIRASIHGGSIVIGETGHRKRQITYLGNTLNLASRLEALAKEIGQSYVVTEEVLQRSQLPKGLVIRSMGEKLVKGSAKKLAVSGILIEGQVLP